MPKMKLKLGSEKAAAVNAFALSFAAFFGVTAIFAAIAGFTKGDWLFQIPLIGIVLANVGFISTAIITSMLSVAFALIGLSTLKQITDKKDLEKPWRCVAKVFLTLTVIYAISLIALAIYSLLGVGKKSGVSHKHLWLSNFLPNVITAATAFTIHWFAKQIAAGKAAILKTFSLLAIAIACIGFILVIVQCLVGFYGKGGSSSGTDALDKMLDNYPWDLFR